MIVIGIGDDSYVVLTPEGVQAASRAIGTRVDLFPGDYTVELNGVGQTVVIQPLEQTSLAAGGIIVMGTGDDIFTVLDRSGEVLTTGSLGRNRDLFPGTYTIAIGDIQRTVTIQAGIQEVFTEDQFVN